MFFVINYCSQKNPKKKQKKIYVKAQGAFSFSTTISHEHFFSGITSGFTRLNEAIKHVCLGPISLHVKFHTKLTMQTAKLFVGLVIVEVWEKEKSTVRGN